MIAENTLTGLGLFSLEIIHLISIGKKKKSLILNSIFLTVTLLNTFQINTLMNFG